MGQILAVVLAGFAASLVDGALGMGFGPTSSTILLGAGLTPVSASGTVNLVKVATGVASALSHWRFRNVDRRLVMRLALPGTLGAVLGVTLLSHLDTDTLRPLLAGLLLLMGLRILWRFRRAVGPEPGQPLSTGSSTASHPTGSGVLVNAGAGGITNGLVGAWGPVVTPYLLHRGIAPRYAVGSANTAEVAVAAVSVASLFGALGREELDLAVVGAMLVGGVAAAPVAAWFVRHVPPRPTGVAVGGLLLVTNGRELAGWAGLGATRWLGYLLTATAVVLTAAAPRLTPPRASGPAAAGTSPAAAGGSRDPRPPRDRRPSGSPTRRR